MKRLYILSVLCFGLIAYAQENEMIKVGTLYVDKYEAPNIAGQRPLVMYNYIEAQNWCAARGKRLLFDDEWVKVAEGPSLLPYVYGLIYDPQICNDNKSYMVPNEILLDYWPAAASNTTITSFSELINVATAIFPDAANEVIRLYQAENSGSKLNCTSYYNINDLNGNVGEWTTRRNGITSFHGAIKGGYWFQPRTIQASLTSYGDVFRDYYLGFRCAKDEIPTLTNLIESNEHVIVFPNPTTNYLTIGSLKVKLLQLINFEGYVLWSVNFPEETQTIDIGYLPRGLYFLKVITEKEIFIKKVIKE